MCIGRDFAMMEGQLALIISRRYRVTSVPGHVVKPTLSATRARKRRPGLSGKTGQIRKRRSNSSALFTFLPEPCCKPVARTATLKPTIDHACGGNLTHPTNTGG